MTGLEIKLSMCTLAVHDLDAALGFYRDVLGFKVRDEVEFEGMRWVAEGPRGRQIRPTGR